MGGPGRGLAVEWRDRAEVLQGQGALAGRSSLLIESIGRGRGRWRGPDGAGRSGALGAGAGGESDRRRSRRRSCCSEARIRPRSLASRPGLAGRGEMIPRGRADRSGVELRPPCRRGDRAHRARSSRRRALRLLRQEAGRDQGKAQTASRFGEHGLPGPRVGHGGGVKRGNVER